MIEVTDLVRVYRVPNKAPGLAGAMGHVVRPRWRDIVALHGVSLRVEAGERIAFVGPNGAGKSTTLKILTGVLTPTSGSVHVDGLVPWRDRIENNRQIGAIFGHRTQLWWDLPVIESLETIRRLYGVDRAAFEHTMDRLVSVLEIGGLLERPARQLSLGERMRCDLAAALLHEPPILYLDEPTIGLDVAVKNDVRQFLRKLSNERCVTLMMASHDIGDIDEICDRLVMMERGRIVYDGSLEAVRARFGHEHLIELVFSTAVPDAVLTARGLLASYPNVSLVADGAYRLQIQFDSRLVSSARLIHVLLPVFPVKDLRLGGPDTEGVIRRLYKGELKYEDG
ncbi:ATP-binding cassette domain-containing protein [Acidiferrobacter sp. SPIII_3]|jgi:ABC-2 type transport system ATP-binding protein|uniref:ABC transporter ATP-binding protein n=1 Tax=Acidiferrobacter sp. SPIII_3 TaxID=1281578 RepID=UPI00143D1A78|nr:ATP-binding cassette domain-containing protein [Acidiferrobacter sp. SPIII_3]